VSEDRDEEVLALLDDDYARAILLETSRTPMSARELTDAIDASPPTVYRRIDALTDCGLLDERTAFVDDGPNYGVYAARVEEVTVRFDDGTLAVGITDREAIETEETVAERFTRMYQELR
jgi:DNA-binding transcriptional ArsR family regulator